MSDRPEKERLAELEGRVEKIAEQLSRIARALEGIEDSLDATAPGALPGGPFGPGDAGSWVAHHYHFPHVPHSPLLSSGGGPAAPGGFVPGVVFSDVRLIARGWEPPFDNTEGEYEDPDVCVVGGDPRSPLPATVECPGTFVIYSSAARVVQNCQGFGGPNDGNNAVVRRARRHAHRIANRIPCEDDCPKRVTEIWKGWECGGNPTPIVAIAAVELKIECRVEL